METTTTADEIGAIEYTTYRSTIDGATVVEIDTQGGDGRVRVNLNDGTIFDADPDLEENFRYDRLDVRADDRHVVIDLHNDWNGPMLLLTRDQALQLIGRISAAGLELR